jgi:hypothetical protein
MPDSVISGGDAPKHCAGTTAEGSACRAPEDLLRLDEDTGEWWCFAHDPTMAEERALAQRKGGLRTGAKARRFSYLAPDELPELDSPEHARDFARIIARATATGRLSSAAAGVSLKAVDAFLRAHEVVELSKQVNELQEIVARVREEREAEMQAKKRQRQMHPES